MALITTFGSMRERRRQIDWRRELPPVLAVAGLAADYLSPPQLWTILLPFGCVVMLLALRKRATAAAVFLLSSWVLIPLAAGTVSAFEQAHGERRVLMVEGATLTTVDEAISDPCIARKVDFQALPVGPGHLVNPRWVLRETIVTFAELHNAMLIDRMLEDPGDLCSDPTPAP
jgi:hypothetical protein